MAKRVTWVLRILKDGAWYKLKKFNIQATLKFNMGLRNKSPKLSLQQKVFVTLKSFAIQALNKKFYNKNKSKNSSVMKGFSMSKGTLQSITVIKKRQHLEFFQLRVWQGMRNHLGHVKATLKPMLEAHEIGLKMERRHKDEQCDPKPTLFQIKISQNFRTPRSI